MSADPTVEAPYIPQDLNRYSYTGNNPLSFTDTSGLCFLGRFWKSSIFKAVIAVVLVAVLQRYELLPNIGGVLGFTTTSATLAAAVNGAILGGIAGTIATGTLKGAAFGALSGGLAFGAGVPLGNTLGGSLAAKFVAQGFVGGLVSVAQGGNFGSGFLAAGVGSLAGPLQGGQFNIGRAIFSAALGGGASVLGGGKFENGAITAAFAYAATARYGDSVTTRAARSSDDEFAGPGAKTTKPWTTQDFVDYYFFGHGETVNLSDVGLGDEFEDSSSVKSLTDKFISDTLQKAYPDYTTSSKGISDVTNEPNLFAVGHSTLFMRGSCGATSCTFNFNIRDWFRDPVSLGFEIPGGTPYRINNDWTSLRLYQRRP